VARYYLTAERLLNDVAVQAGLDAVADPVASTAKHFVQLTNLLNIAAEELAEVHEWEQFNRRTTLTTNAATNPAGEYALPEDFHYMIPQTQWDTTNDLPVAGPLTAQIWSYLKGRDLGSSTIYVSFRQKDGLLAFWPDPPSDGLVIAYEYQSTNWFERAADGSEGAELLNSSDIILFPPSLIRAYLRAKYMESKGFATVTADMAVSTFLDSSKARDQGGPVLSANRRARYPLIDALRNTRDTGYGS